MLTADKNAGKNSAVDLAKLADYIRLYEELRERSEVLKAAMETRMHVSLDGSTFEISKPTYSWELLRVEMLNVVNPWS